MAIKLMRKQCKPGAFSPPPPPCLGTRLVHTVHNEATLSGVAVHDVTGHEKTLPQCLPFSFVIMKVAHVVACTCIQWNLSKVGIFVTTA